MSTIKCPEKVGSIRAQMVGWACSNQGSPLPALFKRLILHHPRNLVNAPNDAVAALRGQDTLSSNSGEGTMFASLRPNFGTLFCICRP